MANNTTRDDQIAVPGFVDNKPKLEHGQIRGIAHASPEIVVPTYAMPGHDRRGAHDSVDPAARLTVPHPTSFKRVLKRAFRIATLVAPSALAWWVAFNAEHPSALVEAVTIALGPLWLALTVALVVRTSVILIKKRGDRLAQIDVLTGAGSALGWI